MSLLGFLAVIGFWLYSARGLVGTTGQFLGVVKPKDSVPVVVTPTIYSLGDLVSTQVPATPTQQPTQEPIVLVVTATPLPTATATPTPTATLPISVPSVLGVDDPGADWRPIRVKMSFYWPPLGGINCDTLPDGSEECEQMATGESWRPYVGKVVACPESIPLGSLIKIDGRVFRCADRGGMITQVDDSTYWVDLLYPYFPDGWSYGKVVDAWVASGL
jgi:hypothetical protein